MRNFKKNIKKELKLSDKENYINLKATDLPPHQLLQNAFEFKIRIPGNINSLFMLKITVKVGVEACQK